MYRFTISKPRGLYEYFAANDATFNRFKNEMKGKGVELELRTITFIPEPPELHKIRSYGIYIAN